MPNLIVEDGSGLVDANSYASVEDGDNYNGGNLYADEWFNAGTDDVETGDITPEASTVNMLTSSSYPLVITFNTTKANALYEPYIWFSSTDPVPEVFDWTVVERTTTDMTIAINPTPSTNNSTLHWRVSAPGADSSEIRDRKETALIMATRSIDNGYFWKGFKTHDGQALKWPRQRVYNRDVYAFYGGLASSLSLIYYPMDQLPRAIKDATCQMALDLLRGDRTVDAGEKGISSLSLGQGAVSVTFNAADRASVLSDEVRRILSSLGQPKSGRNSRRIVRVQ